MKRQLDPKTWSLFQEVVVPAVLGNTAWALASLIIAGESNVALIPKIASLVLLTVFFVGDWIGGVGKPRITSNIRFIVASTVFYSAIVSYAIATASETASAAVSWAALVCFFAITAIGHAVGAWKRVAEPKPWGLVLVSAFLAVALTSITCLDRQFFAAELGLWVHTFALLIYLVAWSKLWRGKTPSGGLA